MAFGARWSVTRAGATSLGDCIEPSARMPSRVCLNNGVWADNVSDSCLRGCVEHVSERATFPAAAEGSISVGTCNYPDFMVSFVGPPTRKCLAVGIWGDVVNQCNHVVKATNGGVHGLRIVNATSDSVTLTWFQENLSQVQRVEVAFETGPWVIASGSGASMRMIFSSL